MVNMAAMRRYATDILLVASLSLLGRCKKQKQPSEVPKPVPIVPTAPGAVAMPVSGRPAIAPANNAPITEAQVRSYVASHGFPHTVTASSVAIQSVTFMTSQQVRSLLHSANLGFPDQESLCLVILTGKFIVSGPSKQTVAYPVGDMVFHARTGNLLQYGALPRAPEPRQ
jgi:hypothetical protein